jgi:hypothetical protein
MVQQAVPESVRLAAGRAVAIDVVGGVCDPKAAEATRARRKRGRGQGEIFKK